MTQHTKGPWTRNRDGVLIGADGKRVVMYGLACSHAMCDPTPEERANAQIAEASPELLAALEALLEVLPQDVLLDNEDEANAAWSQAKAAIAKATLP